MRIDAVLGNCFFHKSGKNWSDGNRPVMGTGLRRLDLGYRGNKAGF